MYKLNYFKLFSELQSYQEAIKFKFCWNINSTKLLIECYKNNEVHFHSTSIKNDKVWDMISRQLSNNFDIHCTGQQCKDRFSYIKKNYIKKKDNMSINKDSGAAPFKFDYMQEMDDIFAKKPNLSPIDVASSSRGSTLCEENTYDECKENILEEETPPKKLYKSDVKNKKSNSQIQQFTEIINENAKHREEMREHRHKEILAVQNRAVDVFENVMNKLLEKL